MTSPESTRSFGRYEVVRPLGRGAVGEVYLARDPLLKREVAVKTLSGLEALPADEQNEARARFLREARAAAGLSHPRIVTIHDVGEADGVPFLAMEYLRGTTLDRYTKKGHLLPAAKVLEIGIDAAAALDEAHRKGIVHRDIKPANVILLEDGTIKVADFGLAKAQEAGAGLTARDTLLGTPNYMSPEQIAGKPLDGRSDLFSLAVSLFELLAGRRPFGGDTVSSVLYRIVNDPPRSLREIDPELPAALEPFFARALAKNAADRFPSGAVVANELAPILTSMGGVPLGLRLPPPGESRGPDSLAPTTAVNMATEADSKHSRRGLVIAIASVVVLLGLAWAVFLGPLAPLLGFARSDRALAVVTDPPGLAVKVVSGNATLDGGRLVVSKNAKGAITVEAGDACRGATATLDPAALPADVRLVAAPRNVTVRIGSEPAGATVQVNGAVQPGVTPLEIGLPACADASVAVSAPGRAPATVTLQKSETPDAWRQKLGAIALPALAANEPRERPTTRPEPPQPAKIRVAAPPGYPADVLVDGRKAGSAGSAFTVPSGEHEVVLSNPSLMLRVAASVRAKPGETADVPVAWPALGALTVRAVPAGGRVLVRSANGGEPVEIGTTPLNDAQLVAGDYEVTVENPGGEGRVVRRVSIGGGPAAVVKVAKEDWR